VKDDQKNFVIFAVLAALILFGWPQISHWIFPQQQPAPSRSRAARPSRSPIPAPIPPPIRPSALRDRQIVLAETRAS
jgi:YidC/Oxa1 family membrane protein insertase